MHNYFGVILWVRILYFITFIETVNIQIYQQPWPRTSKMWFFNFDGAANSPNSSCRTWSGIQNIMKSLDSGFRRNDNKLIFWLFTNSSTINFEKKSLPVYFRRQALIFWADTIKFALISEVGFNTTILFRRFAIFYQNFLFLKMNTRLHTTRRRQAWRSRAT